MRVSVVKTDPGYAPLLLGCKVFFQGYERGYLLTADEEQRLVVAVARDERGNVIVKDGEVVTETLYGDVRIECDPDRLALHQKINHGEPHQ